MKLKNIRLAAANLFFVCLFCLNAHALPGDLDAAFGVGGKVVTQVGIADTAMNIAIQTDGKIVAVGTTQQSSNEYDVVLIRYNSDGSLDSGFGNGGKVRVIETGPQRGTDLVFQPDGKIIVLGGETASQDNIRLYRFNTDGSLDTSFGTAGIAILNLPNSSSGFDMVLQPDGKVVIGGILTVGGFSRLTVFRLTSNGTLDTTFNSVGYNAITNGSLSGTFSAVALQNDGKIIAGGVENTICKLARFNSDGTLEGSLISTDLREAIEDIAVQNDGKIILIGRQNNGFTIARFNSDKTLDSFFGNSGYTYHTTSGPSVVVQPNGKIIVGGSGFPPNTNNWDFVLTRYTGNGIPDLNFGSNGKVFTNFNGGFDEIKDIALQSDGKVVALGRPGVAAFGLVRYEMGEAPALNRDPFDYDGDGKADASVFRPSEGYWYILRSSDNGLFYSNFGLATDKVVPGDFDGDRKFDIAVYRNTQWYVLLSSNNTLSATGHGQAGDIAVTGDYDYDGLADPAIFRNGLWSYRRTVNAATVNVSFGTPGDKPVANDYDGDGRIDLAVYRPSDGTWNIRYSSNGNIAAVNFGLSDDLPVAADYDGDGKTDIAVYRPSAGDWYWLNSSNGSFSGIHWGISTDKPVPADYDGDGKTDVAVFRPSDGTWYIYQSTAGFKAINWGISTDIPTPNVYIR